MQAWDKFLEIKHAQSEEVQELLNKLLEDVQNISEELAEFINSPSWSRPAFYLCNDDEEYTIAITPDLPTEEPDNSLMTTIFFSDEDVPKEIYSNPLFDEEIISDKIDASIISSPKIDSLLEHLGIRGTVAIRGSDKEASRMMTWRIVVGGSEE
ncbi:hypothetical protein Tco_0526201 [Tanacetum coccineum]